MRLGDDMNALSTNIHLSLFTEVRSVVIDSKIDDYNVMEKNYMYLKNTSDIMPIEV